MALRRAFCPNCGGKIHVKGGWPGGLTKKVGRQCQHCGVALTGKVKWPTNMAIPAATPNATMEDMLSIRNNRQDQTTTPAASSPVGKTISEIAEMNRKQ